MILAAVLAVWTMPACPAVGYCPSVTRYEFDVYSRSMVPGTCADGTACPVASLPGLLSPSCRVSGTSIECPAPAPGDVLMVSCVRACNDAGCSQCAEAL